MLTILTGKLWESWRLLQKSFFANDFAKKYQKLLPAGAQKSLKKIKKYFGEENLINKVRNKIAFHYASEEIEKQIEELTEDDIPEIYLSESQGNSLYYFSNLIGTKVLLNFTGVSDPLKALYTFFVKCCMWRNGLSTF